MKKILLTCVLFSGLAGCSLFGGGQQAKKSDPNDLPIARGSVTDVAPSPAPVATLPPPPAMGTPIGFDQPVTESPAFSQTPGAAVGHKYTVKRGDTLWAIAKASYGDGKQYSKIVSANPGLSPQGLRVGQQLNIP